MSARARLRIAFSPGRLLASWQLSVVLMVLGAVFYVLLAAWSALSSPPIVQSIAGLIPFWALYLLLLVNTAFCLLRRVGALRRDLGREPFAERHTARWEQTTRPGLEPEAVRGELGRAGYRASVLPDGRVWAIRGRWSALGPYLFHVAFFVIATGFLLTIGYRRESTMRVAEGEHFAGAPEQLARGELPTDLSFRVERIAPELWRNELLFTSLEATIVSDQGKRLRTEINRPLWIGWGRFLRLSGFGYAPRFELLSAHGGILESAVVKLNIFPPGQRDWFRPGTYPHRVYVEVLPDTPLPPSDPPRSRSLNLVEPALRVHVMRGKTELGSGWLRRGAPIGFEGLALRFPEIRYFGEFTLVVDPGAPVLFAGFAVALLGLLFGLRGSRAEMIWERRPEGGCLRGFGSARAPGAFLDGETR